MYIYIYIYTRTEPTDPQTGPKPILKTDAAPPFNRHPSML